MTALAVDGHVYSPRCWGMTAQGDGRSCEPRSVNGMNIPAGSVNVWRESEEVKETFLGTVPVLIGERVSRRCYPMPGNCRWTSLSWRCADRQRLATDY